MSNYLQNRKKIRKLHLLSTDKEDNTKYTEVMETVETRYPNLDQFDGEEEEGDGKPLDTDEDLSEQDRKYYEKIRNTKLTEQQKFKMAAMEVMINMEKFINSLAFDYLDKIRSSYQALLDVVKTLPTSDELNADNKQLELDGSISDYMAAYFGVKPGDADAMRYHLHRTYHKRYKERNDRLEEYLKNRRKVVLANLQEQIYEIKGSMMEKGEYTVPDPWRLEDEFYHEHLKENSKLTSDFLDLPQASNLKEWKPDGTVPLAITNRWELLTYHLNSIAKTNRDYGNNPESYWNSKRQKMRNDKDFIVGINTLGLTMTTLMKCYGLMNTENSEDMYYLNIFKDALIYHLMQFHISTHQVYDFLTHLLYNQHCDHPVGSIELFGYPDS